MKESSLKKPDAVNGDTTEIIANDVQRILNDRNAQTPPSGTPETGKPKLPKKKKKPGGYSSRYERPKCSIRLQAMNRKRK